jgi:8-oxo-dGTP diphosphatase
MENQVRVGIGVLVFDTQNRMLLGQRLSKHGEGTWSPPGGHQEFGETPEATARRELFEETGLTVEGMEFVGFSNDMFLESGRHYITLYYRCHKPFNQEAKVCEPDKMIAWQWFTLDDLPQPLFLPLKNFISNNNALR